MSIPLLATQPDLRVVSIEPSPHNHRALARTAAESQCRDRWEVLSCALGATAGTTIFHCAAADLGAFDGIRDTGRAGRTEAITVHVRTLDELWSERGRPDVCAIKIDVEGADLDVLRGSVECIKACRPVLLVEWNHENLHAFGHPYTALRAFAASLDYDVFSMPGLVPTISDQHLRTQMQFDESFVLISRAPHA